jgi:hypothetical protein
MAYELRLDANTVRRFETMEDALACARQRLRENPDAEPALRDSETGDPVAPGASRSWREHLSNEVGY